MDATKEVKPFTVVWKNPNPPLPSDGRDLVKCGVCGAEGLPFGWNYYELPILTKMYEAHFWTCSDQCHRKRKPFMDERIKKLS
jgi:hypothetical protein